MISQFNMILRNIKEYVTQYIVLFLRNMRLSFTLHFCYTHFVIWQSFKFEIFETNMFSAGKNMAYKAFFLQD